MSRGNPEGMRLNMTTKDTGTQGVLYIQDTGSYIVLGIRCKDPTFTKSGLTFKWSSPISRGTTGAKTLIPGGLLQAVSSFSSPLSGEVSWTLNATGTSELGGPTTITANISRAEAVPDPPEIERLHMSGASQAYLYWNVRQTGGAGLRITSFDVGYGTNPKAPSTIITNAATPQDYEGSRTITGLAADRLYYFFVRSRNKKGLSAWSEPWGILTSGGVRVMHKNLWRNAVPYVFKDGSWRQAQTHVKHNGSWKKTR